MLSNMAASVGVWSQMFPNFCMGECGCKGKERRPAEAIAWTHDAQGTAHGRLVCKMDAVKDWLIFHSPCTQDKLPVIDMYQDLANRTQAYLRSTTAMPLHAWA